MLLRENPNFSLHPKLEGEHVAGIIAFWQSITSHSEAVTIHRACLETWKGCVTSRLEWHHGHSSLMCNESGCRDLDMLLKITVLFLTCLIAVGTKLMRVSLVSSGECFFICSRCYDHGSCDFEERCVA